MSAVAATTGFANAPLWFTTRSTGLVAFLLLTATMALGVAATQRSVASPHWPRFATQRLHRNLSLLAVGCAVVHALTTVLDHYVSVGWLALAVPFVSSYHRLWVALGTLSFDVIAVVVATSLLRRRLSHRVWRAVHWASYALWPLALLHFLGTGTDAAHGRWGLWLALLSLVVVAAAAVT